MSTIADLKAAARMLGATVVCESSGHYCVYQIEAPKGYAWDSGCHSLRVEWRIGVADYRRAAIADGLERMRHLSRCDDLDCEICQTN